MYSNKNKETMEKYLKETKKEDLDGYWEKEWKKSIIDAGRHAIERSRHVFIVLNISGICIIVGLFNSLFPWIRNTIERADHNSRHLLSMSFVMSDNGISSVPHPLGLQRFIS